jgi:5-hydroxyisourate hydrolase
MVTVSSHTLNSVDGTHAGGVPVQLIRIDADGARSTIFATETDPGGRLAEEVADEDVSAEVTYELVLGVGAYYDGRGLGRDGAKILREAVVRFSMAEGLERYHIPFMLAPHSYSIWYSG